MSQANEAPIDRILKSLFSLFFCSHHQGGYDRHFAGYDGVSVGGGGVGGGGGGGGGRSAHHLGRGVSLSAAMDRPDDRAGE